MLNSCRKLAITGSYHPPEARRGLNMDVIWLRSAESSRLLLERPETHITEGAVAKRQPRRAEK